MFKQPPSRLNVHALIRDMLDDEHTLLTTLGQDFLAQHLNEVEIRLNRWQRYLKTHYADGALPPRGDAGKMHIYQLEQALVRRLSAESQTEAFPIVHQRALQQARRQVKLLAHKQYSADSSVKMAYYEARLKQELLIELWSKWHAWLRLSSLLENSF